MTFSAVEKPGSEDELGRLAIGHPRGLIGTDQTALDSLAADAIHVQASAVVGDLDVDLAAFVERPQAEHAFGRLARGDASLRRFDAVVDGVAHEVR